MVPNIQGTLTQLGTVTVEEREDGHVEVRFRQREGTSVMTRFSESDGLVTVEVWEGRRPPKLGDEVMLDGASVEVRSVTKDDDGTVWVLGDNGKRFKWE